MASLVQLCVDIKVTDDVEFPVRGKLAKMLVIGCGKRHAIPAEIGGNNMIDRLFYGESFANGAVVDFIDFCAFPNVWKYIFNVADACVCVGAGIIMLYLIMDIARTSKEEKNKAENTERL